LSTVLDTSLVQSFFTIHCYAQHDIRYRVCSNNVCVSGPLISLSAKELAFSIHQFITRHSTEARATISLSQTEKECLESVLKNIYGWSSPTAQW